MDITPRPSQGERPVVGAGGGHQAKAPLAQLLIHADDVHANAALDSPLSRLRGRHSVGPVRGTHGGLSLHVDDLKGQRLATVERAGALTDLSLPPGTCVVTATTGAVRRGYTLTLQAGHSFNLHLRLWPEWP